MAKERVKTRVNEGGHNIDDVVIERRYKNGIRNLFKLYLPIVDEAYIYDNSKGIPEILATKLIGADINILNVKLFGKIIIENDRK